MAFQSVRNQNTGYTRVDHLHVDWSVSQSPSQEDNKENRLVPNKGKSYRVTWCYANLDVIFYKYDSFTIFFTFYNQQ